MGALRVAGVAAHLHLAGEVDTAAMANFFIHPLWDMVLGDHGVAAQLHRGAAGDIDATAVAAGGVL